MVHITLVRCVMVDNSFTFSFYVRNVGILSVIPHDSLSSTVFDSPCGFLSRGDLWFRRPCLLCYGFFIEYSLIYRGVRVSLY